MASGPKVATAQWSSRFAFIMAAVGSSVGLGNLWRFSAEAGANGGGAFILIYLMSVVFVGLPVLMSEYLLGRAGQASSAVESIEDLAERSGVSRNWSASAWIGMIASFLIVSFYCVVAAWVIAYIPKFVMGSFNGLSPDQISDLFAGTINTLTSERSCDPIIISECQKVGLYNEPIKVLPYFILFSLITIWLVSRGINDGIEMASKTLMPLFFALLVALSLYGIISGLKSGGTMEAVRFLFTPDFSKINPDVAVRALGQACFSLSIGSAIMVTYGSYIPKDVNVPRAAFTVAGIDTAVALIAGFAIFPIMFTHGMHPGAGPGIFFVSLPTVLSELGLLGNIIGASFFLLAVFAAITSSISLLEPITAWVSEYFAMKKESAAWLMGALMIALGLGSLYSERFFTFIDQELTGPLMLPLSALLVVLFTGWRLKKSIYNEQVEGNGETLGKNIFFLVRYIAPVFITIILISNVYGLFTQ